MADLDRDGAAEVARTMEQRAQLTWNQIQQSGRHSAGTEWIPAKQLKPKIPARFEDVERFMVFRYRGRLPMVGLRVGATFHVIWIEAKFGDLYNHG